MKSTMLNVKLILGCSFSLKLIHGLITRYEAVSLKLQNISFIDLNYNSALSLWKVARDNCSIVLRLESFPVICLMGKKLTQ
jgi:hypothetical protein